tara:strand:+ start:1388 stop:2809 length:1422 start_codon:yes stop_codon:yes gene_type:complete
MSEQPNILIIMTDEHDPGVSSPYGHDFVRTPNMQRLADEGSVFESAYCNAPICAASRASFMTGQHVYRTEVWDNEASLRTDAVTWAHRLTAVGYETCLAGKMHFVGADQFHGFDRRIVPEIHGRGGDMARLADWNDSAPKRHTNRNLTTEPGPNDHEHLQYDELVVDKVKTYLSEPGRKEKPWALCASIFTPHFPFIVRQKYWDMYYPDLADLPTIPEGHLDGQHPNSRRLRDFYATNDLTDEQIRRGRAGYYGLVSFADEQIGNILDALEENDLSDDTIVVYVSDHGELIGEHQMWHKCCFYEESVRIPFIVRWPGVSTPGSRYRRATSLLDLVATMVDAAGAEADWLDGNSLIPVLSGEEEDGDGLAIAEYEGQGTCTASRMVRKGQYKLNIYAGERPELFNIQKDPKELHDLWNDPNHAGILEELNEIATRDWNPEEIRERVINSQQQRRIIGAGTTNPLSPPWRNGNFG